MDSATFAFHSIGGAEGVGGAACAKHAMKTVLAKNKHLRMVDVPPEVDIAIECWR
jgi:hypothetical protein